MTEPGNLNQLVPKGQDWIPRELADLRRLLRRQAGGVQAPTGGGPVSSALYRDPGTPGYGLAFTPSVLTDSHGDISCFNYNGSADIEFLVDGWYQFNVYATITTASAGDVLQIEGDAGWPGEAVGYATSTGGTDIVVASSIPFYSAAIDANSVDGRIYNRSGTGGTVSYASIYVVRLS